MRNKNKFLWIILSLLIITLTISCTVPEIIEETPDAKYDISTNALSLYDETNFNPGPRPTDFDEVDIALLEKYLLENYVPEPEIIIYTARLAFVGDLMAHGPQLDHAYNSSTKTYSFLSCYEKIKPYLEDADYTIGNLETTLAGSQTGYTGYPTFNTPDAYVEALKESGFDMLTTANNHSNDRREAGIVRTIEVLDKIGLDHVGTYATQEEQETIFIKEIGGINFAFLSYTYSTNGIPLTKGKPYLVNMLDETLMKRQIEQSRENGADIVVVLPHMGNEYEDTTAQNYKNLARRLCGYGADIIMASHPHVLQPTEIYEVENADGNKRVCFIAYSMGNFISGQRPKPREASAIFYLDFEKIEDETGSSVQISRASFTATWVQFRNSKWEYDIKVLPVTETLKAVDAGEKTGLSSDDIARMREVHRETTRKLLGTAIPATEMQPIYDLYTAP